MHRSPDFDQPGLWSWLSLPLPEEDSSEAVESTEPSLESLVSMYPDNLPDWCLREALRLIGERNSQLGVIDAVAHGKLLDGKTRAESKEMAAGAEERAKQMAAETRHMFDLSKRDRYVDDPDRDWKIASAYHYFSDDFGGIGDAYVQRRQREMLRIEQKIRDRSAGRGSS